MKTSISRILDKISNRTESFCRRNKYIDEYLFIYFKEYEEYFYIPKHMISLSSYIYKIYQEREKTYVKSYFKRKNIHLIIIETEEHWLGLKNLHFFREFIFCEEYFKYPYIEIYQDYLEKLNPALIDKIKDISDFLGICKLNIFYRYLDLMQLNNYILKKEDVQFIRN